MATGCAFFGAFVLLCLIGATAPEVLTQRASSWSPIAFVPVNQAHETPSSWSGQFTGLSSLNQFMWLDCQLRRDEATSSAKLQFDISIKMDLVGVLDGDEDMIADDKSISRTVVCEQGARRCDTFAVFALETVKYSEYRVHLSFQPKPEALDNPVVMEMQLTLNTLNASWTKFDLCWKYFFLAATLFVLFVPWQGFGYMWELRRIDPASWTSQQKWILGLLFGLVLFNDPLYAAEVYTSSSVALASLYLFFSCTFVCALLHFWLCVLDDMRLEVSDSGSDFGSSGRRTFAQAIRFHSPKLLLVVVIWIVLLAIYSYVRVQRNYDPTYDGVGDNVVVGGQVVLIIAMIIYVIWLLFLLVTGFSAARNLSPPFKLIFAITVFTILCAVVALFGGFLYPIPALGINYLLFYALFSLYVWTLAYSYSPMKDEEMYTPGMTLPDETSIELHTNSIQLGQTYTIEDEDDGDYDDRDARYEDEGNDMLGGEDDDGDEVIV